MVPAMGFLTTHTHANSRERPHNILLQQFTIKCDIHSFTYTVLYHDTVYTTKTPELGI